MFCGQCGGQLQTGTQFCGACGEPISAGKKSRVKIISVISGAVVLAAAAVFLVIFLLMGDDSPESVIEKHATATMAGDQKTALALSAYDIDKGIKIRAEEMNKTEEELFAEFDEQKREYMEKNT